MAEVVYRVVEHDGGWAYQFDGVYSETFPTRARAEAAAAEAAAEQRVPGETETISWQDRRGEWHEELEPGDDRPSTSVADYDAPRFVQPQARAEDRSLPTLLAVAGVLGLVIALLVRGGSRA